MSGLNQLDLGMFDTPAAFEPEQTKKSAATDYVVRFSKTRAGYDVIVCTADPVPDDVLALGEQHNIPVFSGREIMLMRDCDPEMVNHVLAIKRKFPGTSVQEIIHEGRR
jgi:hypothetical protein